MRITKSSIDAAEPGAKDRLLWDDRLPGFGCKVTPKGSKVFVYQYRMGGRGSPARRYTIGKFGPITADQARREAETLALKVAQGIDPQAVKLEKARISVDLAFSAYVDRFHRDYLTKAWPASERDALVLLRRYAVPVLRSKPLPEVTRKDITAVVASARDKVATANLLFATLRRMMRWAVNQGDLERSPMEGMDAPAKAPSRDRVLSDDEMRLVWKASYELGYPFGHIFRLLILTGARREEVTSLDWSELSREDEIWVLPAGRSKNGVAARQPLSTLAMAELDIVAARAGGWRKTGFLFSTTGTTCSSGHSRAKARLDRAIAALAAEEGVSPPAPWRLHDLRRTLATGLQRLGVRFEVTEAVLNHVSGSRGGVAGIYQRHDWADEKRAALEAWARHVEGLLSEKNQTNVVALSEAWA
jgi:integrase